MKVLMVSPHLPAPKTLQAGERLLYGLIRLLSERHEIHLVVRVNRGQEPFLRDLDPFCAAIHPVLYNRPARKNIFTIWKVIHSYARLCRTANELADREAFDLVHAEWTETGVFMKRKREMLIVAVDVLAKPMKRRYEKSRGTRSFAYAVLYWLTKRIECGLYRQCRTVCVMSDYDKQFLRGMDPSLNVRVLTHPVDVPVPSDRQFEPDKRSVLFVGAMDRRPNIEAVFYFYRSILPAIRKQMPDLRFYVVGSRPLPEVYKLGTSDANISVTGFVEDLEPYYGKAHVFVAPLLTGGGILVKIIDAMASGVPVVTTSVGNEGVGAAAGTHLLVADTPSEFADKVILLFHDERLWRHVSSAGRDFARNRFSLENLRQSLENSYPGT